MVYSRAHDFAPRRAGGWSGWVAKTKDRFRDCGKSGALFGKVPTFSKEWGTEEVPHFVAEVPHFFEKVPHFFERVGHFVENTVYSRKVGRGR